jgi:hypothetical protein
MRTNYAEYQERSTYLSTDFGVRLACTKFGFTSEELAEKVGRYLRGPRKGLLKGSITWHKVTRGGWVKTGAYNQDEQRACGFVAKNGVCFAFQLIDGKGEVIAESHVVYEHRRGEKTLDVWGSYAEQERIKYQKESPTPPASTPRVYGLIALSEDKYNLALLKDKTAEEWNQLIGQHVEAHDFLNETLISGTLIRVTHD